MNLTTTGTFFEKVKYFFLVISFCLNVFSQQFLLVSETTNNFTILMDSGQTNAYTVNDYSPSWSRPSYWPIGLGYTVTSWVIPETNILKWVTTANESEGIQITVSNSGRFYVDWYGDGTVVSNYSSTTVATFTYPTSIYGQYISPKAYTLGTTNITSVTFSSSDVTTTFDGKVAECIEVIMPLGAATTLSIPFGYYITSLIDWTTTDFPANFLQGSPSLTYIEAPNKYRLVTSVLLQSPFKFARFDNVRELGINALGQSRCRAIVYIPLLTNILSGAYAGQGNEIVDLPYLKKNVGTVSSSFTREVRVTNLVSSAGFGYSFRLSKINTMPNLTTITDGTAFFYRDNIPFVEITNWVLNLPNASEPATINYQQNPGSLAFGNWYTNGVSGSTPSNNLATKGWYIKWQ